MDEFLEIGQIVSTNGLKGFVNVNPFTDEPEKFQQYETIWIETKKERKEFHIEKVRYHKNQVVIKLKEINSIEEAQTLRNAYIKINRNDLAELEEDCYYIVDLIGLTVFDENHKIVGKIVDVFQTRSNDVYVIKTEKGKEILLPAIADVIQVVDIKQKKMIVHMLDGLLDSSY